MNTFALIAKAARHRQRAMEGARRHRDDAAFVSLMVKHARTLNRIMVLHMRNARREVDYAATNRTIRTMMREIHP